MSLPSWLTTGFDPDGMLAHALGVDRTSLTVLVDGSSHVGAVSVPRTGSDVIRLAGRLKPVVAF